MEQTLPYQMRSLTSREAADSMRPYVAGLQAEVLAYIADHGPVTDAQLIAALGNPNSIRPRRVELVAAGYVVQDGTVVQPNNRKAATWRIVE